MASPRRWTMSATTVAVLLMGAVTLAFGWYGLRVLSAGGGQSAVAGRDAVLLGLSGPEERTARAMAAVVILGVTTVTAAVTVGVARRRVGARHAAIIVFAVLGFLAIAAAVPGLLAEPPRPGAGYGVAVGLIDVAVVVLLMFPGTADAFEDAERARPADGASLKVDHLALASFRSSHRLSRIVGRGLDAYGCCTV